MDSTLKKVLRTITEQHLFRPDDRVVVAVSGGADSTALLQMLTSLTELRLRIIVAHVHHGLRGADSDADEQFVQDLAMRFSVPVASTRIDVLSVSRQRKISLEEAGRLVRYDWFDTVADQWQADAIALGHHADDQAETFLLRLFRGAGTTGLGAMRFRTAERYVRPLLALRRSEIIDYLRAQGQPFREDASNEDTAFLRNRIRHDCIPYLRTINPAISTCLTHTAGLLADDEEVLETVTGQYFTQMACVEGSDVLFMVAQLQEVLPGLRVRLIRKALQHVRGSLRRISLAHVRAIENLIFSARLRSSVCLPGRCGVSREGGVLRFSATVPIAAVAEWELDIPGPGHYQIASGGTVHISQVDLPGEWRSHMPHIAYFDPAAVPFPWTMRTFRPGDRFCPMGMHGHQKVKDFFINMKVPVQLRRCIPLLFSAGELVWVCGFRLAEAARLACVTGKVLRVEIPEITT